MQVWKQDNKSVILWSGLYRLISISLAKKMNAYAMERIERGNNIYNIEAIISIFGILFETKTEYLSQYYHI